MPRLLICALAGLSVASGVSGARAQQPPFGFDASAYGKVDLPIKESTGSSAAVVQLMNGAFEPLHELLPNDPLRLMSAPIGRLDILMQNASGQSSGASCTASLLAGNYILTNSHCVPGGPDETVKAMSLMMNYITQGVSGDRYEVVTTPLEIDRDLDYAILRVNGNPTQKYGAVRIMPAGAEPGQSMLMFHHPLGRPKVMTRFRCFAYKDQVQGQLRHRCDTLPGSSGSLVFSTQQQTIGLHFLGGLDAKDESTFNTATRVDAILGVSTILKQVMASQGQQNPSAAAARPATAPTEASRPVSAPPAPTSRPAPGSALRPDEINDVLRGR
jgi:hypothetical protein